MRFSILILGFKGIKTRTKSGKAQAHEVGGDHAAKEKSKSKLLAHE